MSFLPRRASIFDRKLANQTIFLYGYGRPMRSVVAGGIVLGLGVLTPVQASAARVPGAAPAGCEIVTKALKVPGEPWAQQMLNLKEAWRLSTGRGVRVAVIDSGVDF